MITYDENGDYGHPDHIMAHRVATAAAERAADPAYGDGEPWQVVEVLLDGDAEVGAAPRLRGDPAARSTCPSASTEIDELPFGIDDEVITTVVDATGFGDGEAGRARRPPHADHRRRAVLRAVEHARPRGARRRALPAGAWRARRRARRRRPRDGPVRRTGMSAEDRPRPPARRRRSATGAAATAGVALAGWAALAGIVLLRARLFGLSGSTPAPSSRSVPVAVLLAVAATWCCRGWPAPSCRPTLAAAAAVRHLAGRDHRLRRVARPEGDVILPGAPGGRRAVVLRRAARRRDSPGTASVGQPQRPRRTPVAARTPPGAGRSAGERLPVGLVQRLLSPP